MAPYTCFLHRSDLQYNLSIHNSLARDAAAFSARAVGDAYETIRLLELGRGVVANNYYNTRGDIKDLEAAHPELAGKFKFLCDQLDRPPNDSAPLPSSETQIPFLSEHTKQYDLQKRFDGLVCEIREKADFDRFLLGPASAYLKGFASVGPIVLINASQYGCHAFLVTHSDMKILPLKIFREDAAIRGRRRWAPTFPR